MAITLTQEPSLVSLSHQPQFYMCSSAYSTETGFKYVFIIENKTSEVLNKKVLPFPNHYGRVSISSTLYNYVEPTLLYDTTGSTHTQDTIIQYDMEIGHTGSTHTASPTSQGVQYLLHGADLDFNIGKHYLNNYYYTADNKSMLTNQPLDSTIHLTDYYTLTGLVGNFSSSIVNSSYWHRTFIDVYYSDGSDRSFSMTCDDYNYTPSYVNPGDVDIMCQTVGVGPMNINDSIVYDIDNSEFLTGETLIHSGTTSYRVWIGGSAATRYSPYYTFTVNHTDNKYPLEQICFLNRLGNYSYHTFRGKTRVNVSREDDSFVKNRYDYDENGDWVTTSTARGTTVYNTNVNTEVTFVSDWLNQEWMDFYEELFTSSEVYWLKDGEAISLNVIDNDWESKRVVNDKVVNFSIKCEYANKKYINV